MAPCRQDSAVPGTAWGGHGTNDEISLLRSLEKKSRTITGNLTHKRYDRLETKGYIKRLSQSPSIQDILYEITEAGKSALRAVGGAAE